MQSGVLLSNEGNLDIGAKAELEGTILSKTNQT